MKLIFKVNYYHIFGNIKFRILDEIYFEDEDDDGILIYSYWEYSTSASISLPRMEKWV